MIVRISLDAFHINKTTHDWLIQLQKQLDEANGESPSYFIEEAVGHALDTFGTDNAWQLRLARWYSAAAADPGRSAQDEQDVNMLREILIRHGADPGWLPCAIDPSLWRQE